ncbi:uncharacterized protein BDW70DRAFT_134951 [Aspergillus foveolatus]|uniref:uncharacterized protein n=1 Tax=Aspergillus foveolatus TaxID=210207 RepID=UPI003CCD1201
MWHGININSSPGWHSSSDHPCWEPASDSVTSMLAAHSCLPATYSVVSIVSLCVSCTWWSWRRKKWLE